MDTINERTYTYQKPTWTLMDVSAYQKPTYVINDECHKWRLYVDIYGCIYVP